jgi:hypothetical protein
MPTQGNSYPRMYRGPRKERELEKLLRGSDRLPQMQETRKELVPLPVPTVVAIAPSTVSEPKTENNSAKYLIAKSLVWLGVILLGMSEAGIQLLDGYMQGNEDIPWYIATANKWLPVVRNLGGFSAMLGLPTFGGTAWFVYAFLICWAVNNNLHWNHTTTTNATRAKETQLRSDLEQQYDIPALKQRWQDAKQSEKEVASSRDAICKQNDGTKCVRYRDKLVPEAIKTTKDAFDKYNGAKSKAIEQAEKDTAPIAANQSLWINTILPLIGGILIRLVSRR